MRALAMATDRERAVDIAERAEVLGRALGYPQSQVEALTGLARALADVGEHERALHAIRCAEAA